MQMSLRTSRWSSLSKKRSPKLRSSPHLFDVIFPKESATVPTSEKKTSYLIRNIPFLLRQTECFLTDSNRHLVSYKFNTKGSDLVFAL